MYTFTVTNRYTGQNTTKKIYVGTDPVLKAHATTGESVSDINALLDGGATIREDGTIVKAGKTVAEALPTAEDVEEAAPIQEEKDGFPIAMPAAIVLVVVLVIVLVLRGRGKKNPDVAKNEPPSEV